MVYDAIFQKKTVFNPNSSVWVELLDRNQQNLELVLIPLSFFRPCPSPTAAGVVSHGLDDHTTYPSDISYEYPQILCSIYSHNWINVSILVYINYIVIIHSRIINELKVLFNRY